MRRQAAELEGCKRPVHREKVRRQQDPKDKHGQQDVDHDDHLEAGKITRWASLPIFPKSFQCTEKQQGKQDQSQDVALDRVVNEEGGIEFAGKDVHYGQQTDQGKDQTAQAIIKCDATVVDHGLPLLTGANLALV